MEWAKLAGIAQAILGWIPDQFWASTPKEFQDALSGVTCLMAGDAHLAATHDDLKTLLMRFPDA